MAVICRILNLLAFVAIIVVNAVGVFLPLGDNGGMGRRASPGALDLDPWSYIIWALIYILMFLFIIYQLLPFTYGYRYINRAISPFFLVQALANIGSIFAMAYEPLNRSWINLIFRYLLLITLFLMYASTMSIIRSDRRNARNPAKHFCLDYFFGRFWLSVYLPWVLVDVCVSSFSRLADLSTVYYLAAAGTFAAVGLVTLIVLFVTLDIVFGLTVVWASVWLAYTHIHQPDPNDFGRHLPVFISSLVVGGLVLLATVLSLIRLFSLMAKRRAAINEATVKQTYA